MKRIAVTGGIGEGKSTVLGYLKEMRFVTASTDEIGRGVFRAPEVQRALSKLFQVPLPVSPETIRARLGDSRLRREANFITHPRILAAVRAIEARFVEVPLLVETCLQGEFDEVWVVTCGPEQQLLRLQQRYGEIEARALIRTQLASRAKIPFADRVIRTIGDESTVKRSVSLAVDRDLR